MKRRIRCTLSTLDVAIKALDDYEKSLEKKRKKLLEAVADLGAKTAQSNFTAAEYDGERNVMVSKQWKDSGTVYVVSEGDEVAFIEFGTGAAFPDEHPNANEPWMKHGSWSLGENGKGQWDNPDGWYYAHGRKTKGNPANMCLYYTTRELENQVAAIAREVFRGD